MSNTFIKDAICNIYAGNKSRSKIELVLNTILPEFDEITALSFEHPIDPNFVFKNDKEFVNFFLEERNLSQTFYWNQSVNNPQNIMVGARITIDNKLIVSVTLDGFEEDVNRLYLKLKEILKSDTGVISYFDPPNYSDGADFIERYGQIKYEFEEK